MSTTLKSIMSFRSNNSYLLLLTIPFALTVPLYSSLFNNSLVYSESILSFLIFSSWFVVLSIGELISRVFFIKKLHSDIFKMSNSLQNNFINSTLTKYSTSTDIKKFLHINTSCVNYWESKSILISEVVTIFFLSVPLVFLLGKDSSFPFIYYFSYAFIYHYYKKKAKSDIDKYKRDPSIGSKGSYDINGISARWFATRLKSETSTSTLKQLSFLQSNNFFSEVSKLNSLISMIVIFFSVFLNFQNNPSALALILPMMVINGRVSSLIPNVINRYVSMMNENEVLNSYKDFLEKNLDHKGSYEESEPLKVIRAELSVKHSPYEKVVKLNAFSKDIIAIVGPNSSGKTSLLARLCGYSHDKADKIYLNDRKIDKTNSFLLRNNSIFIQHDSVLPQLTFNDALVYFGIKSTEKESVLSSIAQFMDINKIFDVHFGKYPLLSDIKLSFSERRKLLITLAFKSNASILCIENPNMGFESGSGYFFYKKLISSNDKTLIFSVLNESDSVMKFTTKKVNLHFND